MSKKGISMSIETLGKLVLIVMIGIAIIIFIISGITGQTDIFSQTSGSMIGNVSDKAKQEAGNLVIN